MKVLVIRAHPAEESFNAAACARTIAALERAGHSVSQIDLYAENFDPRMSAAERRGYDDPGALPPALAPYVALLRGAEALVFVFPVWCFGVPAILKGFFDRVFRNGVSFELEGGTVVPKLRHIRRLVAVTSYGRSRWVVAWVADLPRRYFTRYVRLFCHPRVKVSYLALYGMNTASARSRQAFLDRVERCMSEI